MLFLDKLLLEGDPKKYQFCSKGETEIDNVDDKEEMKITDVSHMAKDPVIHYCITDLNRSLPQLNAKH